MITTKDNIMKFIESIFEKVLWNSRFVILIAVVSTLIASIAVFALGTFKMAQTVGHVIEYMTHPGHNAPTTVPSPEKKKADGHGSETPAEQPNTVVKESESAPSLSIAEIVGVIDAYLLAIVLFIFSLGIYELFISQIDEIEKGGESDDRPSWLAIHDLDDLKEKLAKVIIMILMVTFYEKVVQIEWVTPFDMILLAISIFLISLTFFYLGKSKHEPKPRVKAAKEEDSGNGHEH